MDGSAKALFCETAIEIIQNDPWMMDCLHAVHSLALNDWYIAAGFVRNKIWDYQHGYTHRTPLNDIDVVFFDPDCREAGYDRQLERKLHKIFAVNEWSVKNQARMHSQNGHRPYTDTLHAIAHWVETPTCVGVKIEKNGQLTVQAPYGIEHNFLLRVTPNPVVTHAPELYRSRIQSKNWAHLWPKLHIVFP